MIFVFGLLVAGLLATGDTFSVSTGFCPPICVGKMIMKERNDRNDRRKESMIMALPETGGTVITADDDEDNDEEKDEKEETTSISFLFLHAT